MGKVGLHSGVVRKGMGPDSLLGNALRARVDSTLSGPKGGCLGEKRANVCTITARRHLLGLASGLDMWLAATRSCHMPSLRQP